MVLLYLKFDDGPRSETLARVCSTLMVSQISG